MGVDGKSVGSGKRRVRAGLISVDDTIDDVAAEALRAALDAEDKARRKLEGGAGKVEKPSIAPRKTPTPGKNSGE